MPKYEWRCPAGHAKDFIVKYADRDNPRTCECGAEMMRLFPLTHTMPDGMYSYAPNLGSAHDFERKREAIKDGVKVQPKLETPFPIGS